MKISLVINCDTRPENNTFGGSNLMGVVDRELITDGVHNKERFLNSVVKDLEIIVYVDKHEEEIPHIPFQRYMTLISRPHTNEPLFNDWNYIRALEFASGDIIIHADQDTAMFWTSKESGKHIEELIKLLDTYDFISYPSHCSPFPVHDNSFDHTWVSTRFFICKKESLDFPEIKKCLSDYDYWCATYPVARKCHWLEHIIGSIAKYRNQKIYYPPIELEKYAIFSWGSYTKGLLKELNNMPYEAVKQWVAAKGINYPNDIHA